MEGPIPPELAKLPQLSTLHLQNNRLTGFFPMEFGEVPLANQLNIDLSNVYLGRQLPINLQNLSVNFSRYHFYTKLPSATFTSVVRTLDASHNKLFGPIPESFVHALAQVFYLDLSYNWMDGKVSGKVPAHIVNPNTELFWCC